ncbi:MAG TPA: hypothetical protein VN397_02600 [Candidatus Methylomirabilis sp.]|nr:hypothetical protein [Candidatus Methylomirabilis sp.]
MSSLFRRSLTISFVVFAFSVAPAALAAGPSISTVAYPSSVTSNVAATLSVTVSAPSGVKSCNLYVDSEDIGSMLLNGSTASRSHTFPRGGVFTVFVFCRDNAGGMASGPNTSIFVQGPIVQTPSFGGTTPPSEPVGPAATSTPLTGPVPGSLVKLECPANASADHPCKAVYYYGADGKRHAFPNEKVYFTWYADFDFITSVSATVLGSIPLGKNVTYRPGVRMVKFTTLNKVYAVGNGGVLRWVASEDVAKTLYGDLWNTKIDDIPDTFYANYAFGTDIATVAAYGVAAELDAAKAIDDSL